MKKVLFLIFASLLVLGACGQDGDKSNKTDNKQSEHKKSN
ncbi:lipoprotein, partial [Streptococcus equi]|nr:lipoprotein [Streptococcus equi]